MYRHENALRSRERIGFYAVFYRTPEMEQTVDRGPRSRHSAQTRRVARLRINLIISATKSSGYAEEIHKEARGSGGGGSADRVDTSRDNGDYRGEHSVFPPSLPHPPHPTDSAGREVPSVCLISGIQSLGSMPGQPTASLSTNRSFVQSYPLPPPSLPLPTLSLR